MCKRGIDVDVDIVVLKFGKSALAVWGCAKEPLMSIFILLFWNLEKLLWRFGVVHLCAFMHVCDLCLMCVRALCVYLCMCVCMCVCVYVSMCVCVCICVYVCISVSVR